jgi:hypothetical protein
MAVLKARLHASDAAAAAVTGDAATADSGEGSSQQAALLHRLQVLRQRQADVQESAEPDALLEQAAATTAAAGGSATASAEQVALLQRLQVLQQRDQQLQHQQQQGTAIEPGNPGLPTAAAAEQVSLLQRLQVLQQRHVVGSSADGYTQVDCSGLQTPGDFVECMRQLLASGELTEDSHFEVDDLHGEEAGVHSAEVPSGHAEEVQCADVDMACDGSSHLETAAGSSCAAAAAAGGGDGDAASPMCVSPVRCGGTAPAAELPTQQQQQQHRCVAHDQQQEQQQQQQQQELAVPSHLRRLLVLAAQSLSAGRFAEAKDRAADALSGAAALDNSSSSVSSFSREAERLLAVAAVLLEVAQQHWLAALQLPIGPLQQQQQQQHLPATPMSDAAAVTVGDVRRAYRRLAALVHPDKCRHPTAETAFKALTTAYEQALDQLKAAGSGMSGTAGQEDADVDDWGDPTAAAAAAACVDGGGIGNDYAWWTEWEQDVSEGNVEGAAAAGGDWGRPAAAAAAAAQGSQASAADEEEELWALSMQVQMQFCKVFCMVQVLACCSFGSGWLQARLEASIKHWIRRPSGQASNCSC